MCICKFCGKEQTNRHSVKCQKYRKFCSSITEEQLKHLYIDLQLSGRDIKEELGLLSEQTVFTLLRKFNIPRRDRGHAARLKNDQIRSTNIEKYGSPHNFCREHPSRKAFHQKLLTDEGLTTISKRETTKQKMAETICEKYPKEDILDLTYTSPIIVSLTHKKVAHELLQLGYDIYVELKLKREDGGYYYSYDIVCDKKIIEIYGDFWHGNPNRFTENDIIMINNRKSVLVKEKWEMDKLKNAFATSKGYQVMVIWESEIEQNFTSVIQRLVEYLDEN